MKLLKESLRNAPVIMKGNYPYFIHPLTDGIPEIDPAVLKDAVNEIIKVIDIDNFDKIVAVEAMGLPIGVALSMELTKPMTVIRKRPYGLPGEVEVEQHTGYSRGKLYINSITSEDRVLLVDDVLSTGGTITAVVNGIRRIGAEISDIVVVVNKNKDLGALERKIGYKIKTIVNIEIVDGRVKVLD
ncbi:PRPP-binding protein, adenine/guanine phosphoribosyltransferase [Aciduliprofundum sp. MAR08-339]|uniref:hypoxanthine/guanine phosphoribosyltransferase n=1 Tax=Aciduliprofundum sp. (strain MAR08-339) TaxID=673860 RepID=UPI0002A49CE2|nr:PRPP-binding protein, adenine/guanine phosphoribosyltransferase [Aciduliprofundum sp. MAR08-339]